MKMQFMWIEFNFAQHLIHIFVVKKKRSEKMVISLNVNKCGKSNRLSNFLILSSSDIAFFSVWFISTFNLFAINLKKLGTHKFNSVRFGFFYYYLPSSTTNINNLIRIYKHRVLHEENTIQTVELLLPKKLCEKEWKKRIWLWKKRQVRFRE